MVAGGDVCVILTSSKLHINDGDGDTQAYITESYELRAFSVALFCFLGFSWVSFKTQNSRFCDTF